MPLQYTYTSTALGAQTESDTLNGVVFTKELFMYGQQQYGSAAAGSYQETSLTRPIWTCDAPCVLVGVQERHSVLGSTTIQVVHAIGSTPLGSAANVLSAAMGGTTAVDVVVSGTLLNSATLTSCGTGDQFGVRWNTPGNLAPTGVVTLVLQRL